MGTRAFGEEWEVGLDKTLARLRGARGGSGLERTVGRGVEVAGRVLRHSSRTVTLSNWLHLWQNQGQSSTFTLSNTEEKSVLRGIQLISMSVPQHF